MRQISFQAHYLFNIWLDSIFIYFFGCFSIELFKKLNKDKNLDCQNQSPFLHIQCPSRFFSLIFSCSFMRSILHISQSISLELESFCAHTRVDQWVNLFVNFVEYMCIKIRKKISIEVIDILILRRLNDSRWDISYFLPIKRQIGSRIINSSWFWAWTSEQNKGARNRREFVCYS